MNAEIAPRSSAARLMFWWIAWVGILAGLAAFYFALGQLPEPGLSGRTLTMDMVGLALLLASCGARWWVLPRVRQIGSAYVLFMAGLALAAGCGYIGILAGLHRDGLFVLGVLGLFQWLPVFARRFVPPAAAVHPPAGS